MNLTAIIRWLSFVRFPLPAMTLWTWRTGSFWNYQARENYEIDFMGREGRDVFVFRISHGFPGTPLARLFACRLPA